MNKKFFLNFGAHPPVPEPGKKTFFCHYEAETERVLDELGQGRAVALGGPPGCGKSAFMAHVVGAMTKTVSLYRVCDPEPDCAALLNHFMKKGRGKSKKNYFLLDDLDKAAPDQALKILLRLKPLFEMRSVASLVSLPESLLPSELPRDLGMEPSPLLGIFSFIFPLKGLEEKSLLEILRGRLEAAAFASGEKEFAEPEALALGLAASGGSPQRWLHILKEGCYKACRAGRPRLGFNDIYEVLEQPCQLDLTFKRILYILAKKGPLSGQEKEFLDFTGLDRKSLRRRLDLLVGKRLLEARNPNPDNPASEYILRPSKPAEKPSPAEKPPAEEGEYQRMHS